jgi:hypothetical protein
MINLPNQLMDDILDYCRLNNIPNIDDFIIKMVRQGFTVEKYGATPVTKTVEKIVEKIVEVPVEKIVEKIVEVPVEMEDDELKNSYEKLLFENGELRSKIDNLISDKEEIIKELDIQKQKNKRNIYGE